jgi:histidinol phosphatase-like enzyme (inositol monophosphatase family)
MDPKWIEASHNWLDEVRWYARKYFRSDLQVTDKKDASPVTIADRQIEAIIRERIRAEFPDHGIIGEEEAAENPSSKYQWVIDPIDGTRSFITGNPLFGTLLSLVSEDEFLLGLMDLPMFQERWWATHGGGSYFQDNRCSTSSTREIQESRLVCTSPVIFSGKESDLFQNLAKSVRVVRYGGDCFNYGALACGWVDLVAEASLQFYDIAAMVVVIQEAGGIVTDWSGDPIRIGWNGTALASANLELHRQALELLNESQLAS